MKNPFPLITVFLCAGYSIALIAELFGFVSSSVVTFPRFLGCFVASGLLAIVVNDYSRKALSYDARPFKRRQPLPTSRAPSIAPRAAAWLHRTVS